MCLPGVTCPRIRVSGRFRSEHFTLKAKLEHSREIC
uniref:Uncharacterized protein n=1 Tax=Anguilla anguilla TaxID=7936 RepID=A0A0E9PTI1_ANGAN